MSKLPTEKEQRLEKVIQVRVYEMSQTDKFTILSLRNNLQHG